MTILSLSSLRCCVKGTALKYALCVAWQRLLWQTQKDISFQFHHLSAIVGGIAVLPFLVFPGEVGERGKEKNGCCLPSNSGIIMTSQGTVIAKYYHSSDYKLNETIFLMLYSRRWLSRWLLSLSYFFLYLFIAKEQKGVFAQCLECSSENAPWKIANFLKTNNLSTMSSQTLIFQEQKPSMNCSLCTLHKKKVSRHL